MGEGDSLDRIYEELKEIRREQTQVRKEQAQFREEVLVEFARLPHAYVPRSEHDELKAESTKTRRYVVTTGIGIALALLPILNSVT